MIMAAGLAVPASPALLGVPPRGDDVCAPDLTSLEHGTVRAQARIGETVQVQLEGIVFTREPSRTCRPRRSPR